MADSSVGLLARLRAAISQPCEDKVPDGAKSAAEWGKEWRLSATRAAHWCKRFADQGLMEKFTLKRICSNGALRDLYYYREVKPRKGKGK